jgi:hypothetical protein
MHGLFGQCRPRRSDAQTQGCPHVGPHVDLPDGCAGRDARAGGRPVSPCYAPPVRDFLVDVIDVPPGET